MRAFPSHIWIRKVILLLLSIPREVYESLPPPPPLGRDLSQIVLWSWPFLQPRDHHSQLWFSQQSLITLFSIKDWELLETLWFSLLSYSARGTWSGRHPVIHVTLCAWLASHGHLTNINKGCLPLLPVERYRSREEFWVSYLLDT